MSYDAFTYSAITIIVIFIFVIILVGRGKAATEIKLRNLSKNLLMVQSNEDAVKICKKIRKKHPDLCAGIDFTLKDGTDGVEIDEWNSDKPRPDV